MKIIKGLIITALLLTVAVFGPNVARSKYQSFRTQQVEDQKIQQIKDITEKLSTDSKHRDHTAQATKELREKLCSLTTRPVEERGKAVVAIRDFLEMPTVEVEYECNNAFYNLEDGEFIPAKGETYTVGEGEDFQMLNCAINKVVLDKEPSLELLNYTKHLLDRSE